MKRIYVIAETDENGVIKNMIAQAVVDEEKVMETLQEWISKGMEFMVSRTFFDPTQN